MLVSHRYRFIYTKTVKTAGTSVESFLEPFCLPEGEWQATHFRPSTVTEAGIIGYRGPEPAQIHPWWNHMPAWQIRQQLGEDLWQSYFKFCVIRNPFEKCISAYEHFGRQFAQCSLMERLRHPFLTREQLGFLRYLQNAPPMDRDKYQIDNEFCLDDVIRFETISDDLQRICRQLQLPITSAQLPSFKQGIRRANATPANRFSKPARALVEELFAWELAHFQYCFPKE